MTNEQVKDIKYNGTVISRWNLLKLLRLNESSLGLSITLNNMDQNNDQCTCKLHKYYGLAQEVLKGLCYE